MQSMAAVDRLIAYIYIYIYIYIIGSIASNQSIFISQLFFCRIFCLNDLYYCYFTVINVLSKIFFKNVLAILVVAVFKKEYYTIFKTQVAVFFDITTEGVKQIKLH